MGATTLINTPNQTQYFYPADDKWDLEQFSFKVSTAMTEWAAIWIEIVSNTTTWNVALMGTENAAWADFVGILAEWIAATDSDYATAWKKKGVWVPRTKESKAFFAVAAWTFTSVEVFKTVQFASTSLWLDVDTAWKGARIVDYISSTVGKCKFNLPNTETA